MSQLQSLSKARWSSVSGPIANNLTKRLLWLSSLLHWAQRVHGMGERGSKQQQFAGQFSLLALAHATFWIFVNFISLFYPKYCFHILVSLERQISHCCTYYGAVGLQLSCNLVSSWNMVIWIFVHGCIGNYFGFGQLHIFFCLKFRLGIVKSWPCHWFCWTSETAYCFILNM